MAEDIVGGGNGTHRMNLGWTGKSNALTQLKHRNVVRKDGK